MKVGELNFLEYLAGEEQNLLTSIINFRPDFDALEVVNPIRTPC